MIIDGKKIAKVEVVNQHGNVVAVIEDDGATKSAGYDVNVYLDLRPGPDAVAMEHDVLRYHGEDDKYLVIHADRKFFIMAPIVVDKGNNDIRLDCGKTRTYPNNKNYATLNELGLVLDYREVPDGEEKIAAETVRH